MFRLNAYVQSRLLMISQLLSTSSKIRSSLVFPLMLIDCTIVYATNTPSCLGSKKYSTTSIARCRRTCIDHAMVHRLKGKLILPCRY